jgi:hypothetical protein
MALKLYPFSVIAPGFLGLNKQRSANPSLGLEWCTVANNCVIDDSGRLAARKGWEPITSSAISGTPDVKSLGEQLSIAGVSTIISAANHKIYTGTTTLTDVTGTITTPTGDDWKFLSFNGKCVGMQLAHTPIVRTTGNFADVVASSGTLPTGHACLAAFGRIWATKSSADRTVLLYCDLLNEAAWGAGSAGSLDVKNVWPGGMDEITALAEFQGRLVIFGKRNILIYTGASTPSTMVLEDAIQGIGCIARDSVQDVGTDILFLSTSGVRSLSRTIQNETAPIGDISANVRDFIQPTILAETANSIRSVYHEPEGLYIINFPSSDIAFCFNLKYATDSGEPIVTTWDSINPKSMLSARNSTLYVGKEGVIGRYTTNYKDNTTAYTMTYESPWSPLDPELISYIKILKGVDVRATGGYGYTATFKYALDYVETFFSVTKAVTILAVGGTTSQYGVSEYGIAEYGGSSEINSKVKTPLTKSGKVFKIGIEVDIDGQPFSVSKIDLYIKLGRTT